MAVTVYYELYIILIPCDHNNLAYKNKEGSLQENYVRMTPMKSSTGLSGDKEHQLTWLTRLSHKLALRPLITHRETSQTFWTKLEHI